MLEINLSQFKIKQTPQNHQSGDNKLLNNTLSWINEESIEYATNEPSSEENLKGKAWSQPLNTYFNIPHSRLSTVVLKPMSLK